MKCLLIQPIHAAGIDVLQQAGIEVSQASAADMVTVAREIGAMDAVVTRNAGLDGTAMEAAPKLKVLGVHGTGYDRVDVACAKRLNLPMVYTPYANVQSVAEHAIAQMMAISKRIREADRAVREDRFGYRYESAFHELAGRTLAVIGFGKIGKRVAEIASAAFQMQVRVFSPSVPRAEIEATGFSVANSIDEAIAGADVVSLHQRLTAETRGVIDAKRLAAMKAGAMLVNTARGGLVDADALIASLDSGHLMGAAFDVFDQEPLPAWHPFIACERIVLSPHIGGATGEAMRRTAIEVANQIVDVLAERKPKWLINPDVWTARV
ncbi:hypothetical protein CIC12_20095 [Burkholderia sp. SG-MS1]|uniref:hydroxyacid dehydrogenase n=1 Tax=Paraburkholderia sp. SG-MS1 TaxID=2023741 RepID=UPI00144797BB|nr:hydroxyacid dehydrogenase [Paraburkholderia sp. SG-MS1]NKJ48997.1 hypothetical protein [Paraburkholderia sp. SG-MS1]